RLPDPVPDEGLVPADLVPAPLAGAPEYVGRLLRQLFLIVVGTRLKLELPCDHLGCRLAVPERLEDSIEERLLVVTADAARAGGQAGPVAPLTSPTRMPTRARLQSRVSAIPGRL